MTDNDDLRERARDKCIICGEPLARHNMGHGIPTCRVIATYRAATPIAALQQRVERLEAEARYHKEFAERTHQQFAERMGDRKRPTWWAVNALQEYVDFHRLFQSRAVLGDDVG